MTGLTIDPLFDPGGGAYSPFSGVGPTDGNLSARMGLVIDPASYAATLRWRYREICAVPLVEAIADTTIVLLKVACWANDKDVTVIWSAGTSHATMLEVALAEDTSFTQDDLHLVVPAGENLDLDFNGGTVGRSGATTWWYTIKQLIAASPAV